MTKDVIGSDGKMGKFVCENAEVLDSNLYYGYLVPEVYIWVF